MEFGWYYLAAIVAAVAIAALKLRKSSIEPTDTRSWSEARYDDPRNDVG